MICQRVMLAKFFAANFGTDYFSKIENKKGARLRGPPQFSCVEKTPISHEAGMLDLEWYISFSNQEILEFSYIFCQSPINYA